MAALVAAEHGVKQLPIIMNDDKKPKIKQCIACKSDIHADATICSVCQSYQSNWKNNLKFIASIIGIGSIIGALFVYSVSNLSEIRKVLLWHDEISVISFVAFDHITLSNNGDGVVFISHLSFGPNSEEWNYSVIRQIGITLDPGEAKIIDLPDQFNADILKGHYVTVGGVNNAQWSQILAKTFPLSNPCYVYNVFLSDDPGFLNMQSIYSKGPYSPLRTFKAKATITFYPLKSGEMISYNIPVVGTISVDSQSDGCKIK